MSKISITPTSEETIMKKQRTASVILSSSPVIEGAGVHLHRVFGFSNESLFDPFLLLDDFRSDTPSHYLKGFPWHPHRGIETITYVLKGDVEHGDSLGNTGVISTGDVQWMTAGSGIVHQEMPKGDKDGLMYGFQLWANLPAQNKMMPPRYCDIKRSQIPEVHLNDGISIKIIAGTVNGTSGPMSDIIIKPEYLDCSIPAEATYSHPIHEDHTAFIYVIEGSIVVDCKTVEDKTLVVFTDGDCIDLTAGIEGARCLFISGKPLKEPIAWRGPIVMNTEEELDLAFREYQDGTFIK